jgi:hypothetical protein
MIEEIATGSLGTRFVVLSDSRDQSFDLKPLQGFEDCASRGTGLCHKRTDGGIARELLVCLVREQNEYKPHRRRADSDVSRPVKGLPTHRLGRFGIESSVVRRCQLQALAAKLANLANVGHWRRITMLCK